MTISGFPVSSSTNAIDEAIEGVTINLLKAEEGAEFTLNVSFDSASVTTRIQNFVTEYNNMQAQLTKLGNYDAASKTGGPLLGDALLRSIAAGHASRAHEPGDGHRAATTPRSRASASRRLPRARCELDAAKLNKALDADPDAVAHLFGSENGVAARLYAQVDARLATGSDLDSRNTTLKRRARRRSAATRKRWRCAWSRSRHAIAGSSRRWTRCSRSCRRRRAT